MSVKKAELRTGPCRYKQYVSYKESGVDWLGKIPAGWEAKRLKNCVERLDSGGTPESDNSQYWSEDESGIPWVAISDMTRSFRVRETAKRLTERGLQSKRLPVLPTGTLLYSMYASLGKVALLEIDAVVNQAILGLVTRDELVSRDYLRWWLEFIQGHVQLLSSSNTQDNLNAEKVQKMPVFIPGSVEQRAIAGFLDRETVRIDALVAKKERLVELLREQRSALISRAVTKGLDPTVPMKDSGVDWLGEIPAHWDATRMWRISTATSGGTPLKEERRYWDGDIPWVSPKDMKRRFIDSSIDAITETALAETGLKLIAPSAVLIVVRGMILAHTFPVAITTAPVTINQDMKALRFRSTIAPAFAAWLFEGIGKGVLTQVVEEAAHGTRVIRMDQWRNLLVLVPPKGEQAVIVGLLDRETARIDALLDKVRDAIARLHELRTALISAAVTGKIDVREEVA